ncbi:winged helix DNA-binding domain-containing protein [Arsenicibacter rosenii]|uniref:Winged helix DNA-binding domain-containing protein n=1 Tax=Arsenicibacter rosenii TaxID=1750698 RepID=A0A1S2VJ13_9BACT|nr:winged helix DNA-binding domain-containing protein [Arsenicibacter rosenii]OIN58703.1 hypothetical protein BLX24_14190 [Arsenicibacter rosenii]
MNPNPIAIQRLHSQQLIQSDHTSVSGVVRWMGAMQAQDYDMAKWGIGARLLGSTEAQIEAALDRGEIVRTHIMRPTWHFVAADDIYWLLDLTAPHVKRALAGYLRKQELDEPVLQKSGGLIEQALDGQQYLTRQEIMTLLQQHGIPTNDLRSANIMFWAELTGLVCNGPRRGKAHTYGLLRERVPVVRRLDRDEALAELATRYFASHGPASLRDFVWWSGLGSTDARKAIQLAGPALVSQTIQDITYWMAPETVDKQQLTDQHIHFLPAFDEFMVSYTDRSASINPVHVRQAMTGNGIFWPIIVVDGQVIGVWKRAVKPTHLQLDCSFFAGYPEPLIRQIRDQIAPYGAYWQLPVRFK